MTHNIFRHPGIVSGIATENGTVATMCSDGHSRMFNPTGSLLAAEFEGWGINSIAMRNGEIATDTGLSILHEGVAISVDGEVVRGSDFAAPYILDICKSGTWGVGTDQFCYNRITKFVFRCVPLAAGSDKWPMGIEEFQDGSLVVVAHDGFARVFAPDGTQLAHWQVSANGLCAVDVAANGIIAIADYTFNVSRYSPTGTLLSRCSLQSLPHAVQFDGSIVLIGMHTGELLWWDGANGDAPVQIISTPVRTKPGKRK